MQVNEEGWWLVGFIFGGCLLWIKQDVRCQDVKERSTWKELYERTANHFSGKKYRYGFICVNHVPSSMAMLNPLRMEAVPGRCSIPARWEVQFCKVSVHDCIP